MIKELTKEEIDDNYETFKTLLRESNRENIEELISYIDSTDFKYAPASTKYHGSFKGGLCKHSLSVYYTAIDMYNNLFAFKNDEVIKKENIIISCLLHDISKVNTYEESVQNKKVYSESGSKYDELGNYDWVSVKCYKTKDYDDRFVYINHELTSEFIARQFIGLTIAESAAIAMHHNGMGHDSIPSETTGLNMSKYPLALLLHSADLLTAYMIA